MGVIGNYSPEHCSCCNCDLGTLEYQTRGDIYTRAGYYGFLGTKYYRTAASRGWGTQGGSSNVVKNDVQCTYQRGFVVPAEGELFRGSLSSKIWVGPGLVPFAGIEGTLPSEVHTTCAEGFFDFVNPSSPGTVDAWGQSDYDPIGNVQSPIGPRGQTRLLNPIAAETLLEEAAAFVEGLAWGPATYTPGFLVDSLSVHCLRMRYRRVFVAPRTGAAVRFAWTERFTPSVGAVVDTPMHYVWDHETVDELGHPCTPWFETPHYTGSPGTYSLRDWVATCGRTPLPEAPAEIGGQAA